MTKHLEARVDPITEDEDFIARALEELSPPALIMSIVHMTGNTDLLKSKLRPRVMDVVEASTQKEPLEEGSLTLEQAAEIRSHAAEAIRAYRDGGCELPTLSDDVINEMLDFMSGHHLDGDYREFIKEEIAIDGVDHRGVELEKPNMKARAANFPVVIIGAGMGGLLAAIRLDEAGIPCTVIEKNPAIGGTWYENRYPGCRVDVQGHSYSYSFEPNHDWSSHYPKAKEIHDYYEHCTDEYRIRDKIRFNTEVESAIYDDTNHRWTVTVVTVEGNREQLEACAVISAVGQLNRPKLPAIEGLQNFAGPVIHSGAWPKGCDLSGQRVAVIGSGASALQIIPEMAKADSTLLVFQRSPAWMFPNLGYHSPVTDAQRWALKKLPYYSKWYRFWLFYSATEGVFAKTQVDPEWNSPLSVSASNEEMRILLTEWIKSQIDAPELVAKLVPDYPPFGKRILQDNGCYLQALKQDNVDLITDGIEKIVENGIVTHDGILHEVDSIVCATGFHANRFLFPMKVTGRNGIDLNEQWEGNNGRAYLGITVPNFPNLFCIYGPNTNLVVAGSIAHNAESQVNYILHSFKLLFEAGKDAMDCRQDVHDDYNNRVDEANEGAAWGWPGVNSWYKNDRGRITANLPFRIIEYWRMTKQTNPADYHFY
ncbi:MAG: 4-hydroxyacetophenone monooxygenase [Bacteroidia bacterium]|jgi:4-hydroxyacetophenone monooxygenase